MLYRIESGAWSVRADGPISVTPAGATGAASVPTSGTTLLSPGDRVFIDAGVTSQWRNDGPSPAVVLVAGLSSFAMYNFPSGISFDGLSVGMTLNATPTAPAEFTLRRLILAPGARLPVQRQPGLEALGVESGGVHVALGNVADPSQQADPRLMLAGSWLDLNAQVYDAKGQHYVPSEIRNDGDDAATLFLMTVTPLGEQAGTPSP
jgi:quercetin dioxygenase-like cupin family protein